MKPVVVLHASPHAESTPCVHGLVEWLHGQGWPVRFLRPCIDPPRGDEDAMSWPLDRAGFARRARALLRGACGVVAIERTALLAAAALAPRATPVVYSSTEIFLPPVFTARRHRALNAAERIALRRAAIVLSPSAPRALLHGRLFDVEPARRAVLPNAPRGNARWAPRGNALCERLGIDPSRKVVLYAGALSGPNRIQDLLASAREWPSDWVLVLHGREPPCAYVERAARAAGERVVLSREPLPADELRAFVQGADVAVALYREDGPTFQSVGTAAGKVATALHAGVPVATTKIRSLEYIFLRCGGGVAVDAPGGLRAGIEALLARGDDARRDAAACFQRAFHFDRAIERLRPRLVALLGEPPP